MNEVIYLIWSDLYDYHRDRWRRRFVGYTTETPYVVDGEQWFHDASKFRRI